MKRVQLTFAFLLFAPALLAASQEPADTRYHEAYDTWMKKALKLDPSWWFSEDRDAPLFQPLANLKHIGPNITPFLVEELRQERDRNRVYRLCTLLSHLSGIDPLLGKPLRLGGFLQDQYADNREEFLAAWDSGAVTNPTDSLRIARQDIDEDRPVDNFDYRGSLGEVRSCGIYALPFIVGTLKQHNSDELFAAFLAVTAQYNLYTRYCNSPRQLFASHADKIGYLKAWFKANETRIDRLSIHERLKLLVQQ
jgi:hypothetical protein